MKMASSVNAPVSFDLTDPAERFIVEVIQQFHTSQRRRYRVLAMRRAELTGGESRRRLVLQAVRFQPRRRGARPEWEVLVWDIDGPGVTFLKQRSRGAALALCRTLCADKPARPGVGTAPGYG